MAAAAAGGAKSKRRQVDDADCRLDDDQDWSDVVRAETARPSLFVASSDSSVSFASTFDTRNRPFKFQVPYDGRTEWVNHFTVGRGRDPLFRWKPSHFFPAVARLRGDDDDPGGARAAFGVRREPDIEGSLMGGGRGARRRRNNPAAAVNVGSKPGQITEAIRGTIGTAHLKVDGFANSVRDRYAPDRLDVSDLSGPLDFATVSSVASSETDKPSAPEGAMEESEKEVAGIGKATEEEEPEAEHSSKPNPGLDDIADMFFPVASKKPEGGEKGPEAFAVANGGVFPADSPKKGGAGGGGQKKGKGKGRRKRT